MNHSAPGCLGQCRAPSAMRRAAHDAQDAVGADAEAPVAQRGDLIVGEVELAVGIGDQHEVVAGAVALGEGDGLRHRHQVGSLTGAGLVDDQSAMRRLPVVDVSNRSYPSAS